MSEIVILTPGRSGSTYFLNNIANIPEFYAFGEIFSNDGLNRLNGYENDFISKTNIQNDDLYEFIKHNPEILLDFLKTKLDDRYKIFFYKILIHQLQLKHIIKICKRSENKTIFLVRNVIDTYISDFKAEHFSVYTYLDTTNYKPEIDINLLMDFYYDMNDRLIKIYDNVDTIKIVIGYENFIDVDQDKLIKNYIKLFLIFGINIPTFNLGNLPKQDKNSFWGDKISNYNEINHFIIENNLQDILCKPFLHDKIIYF